MAYRHVLITSSWSDASVADAAGIPVSEAEPVLRELERFGLMRASQEDPRKLVPVAPAVGLRHATESIERALDDHVTHVRGIRTQCAEITETYELHRMSVLQDRLEVLVGRDAAVRRVSELCQASREHIATVVSTLPSPAALEQARRVDSELFARGVVVRAVFMESHRRQSAPLRAYLDWIVSQGGHVRITQLVPSRLILVDSDTAVVASDPADPGAGALVVREPGLVNVASALFEAIWRGSATLSDASSRRQSGGDIDDVEATVLQLLSEGLKDEAVARRTGLSLRSVRRVITRLNTSLGARSRFELGWIARNLER